MILVADAHVSERYGNDADFFKMLAHLEQVPGDLVFLGDIFELWISLPRYEDALQKRFVAWCKTQSAQRTLGFVEGNHEFFVVQQHRDCFSWSSEGEYWDQERGILFCHGDQVNRQDKNYLRFRKLTNNPVAKLVTRLMPLGPRLVHRLNHGLKKTNKVFRIRFPEEEVTAFARREFAKGRHRLALGHFHQAYRFDGEEGQMLQVVPDWYSTQNVAVYHREKQEFETCHWQDLQAH